MTPTTQRPGTYPTFPLCGHVLSAFLDGGPLSRDPAKRNANPYAENDWGCESQQHTFIIVIGGFVRRAAWRGLLARREAGGTDAAQCWLPPGVELRRVARRHMLLHRARWQRCVRAGTRAPDAPLPPPPPQLDPVAALFGGFIP